MPPDVAKTFSFKERKGIVGEVDFSKLGKCVACGRKIIEFYPNYINQVELISEAIRQEGFIGYMLKEEEQPIGFSFGYKVPKERTASVNFPLVSALFFERGINIERTFYGAELGVSEEYRGRGYGTLISAVRLNDARANGYESFAIRTKNLAVLAILKKVFSLEETNSLFLDPERETPWFLFEFKTFNLKRLENMVKMGEIIQ